MTTYWNMIIFFLVIPSMMQLIDEFEFWKTENPYDTKKDHIEILFDSPHILWFKIHNSMTQHVNSVLLFQGTYDYTQPQYQMFLGYPQIYHPFPHTILSHTIEPLQHPILSIQGQRDSHPILTNIEMNFLLFQFLLYMKELEPYHLTLSFPLISLLLFDPSQQTCTKRFQILPDFQGSKTLPETIQALLVCIEQCQWQTPYTEMIREWVEDPPPSIAVCVDVFQKQMQNDFNVQYVHFYKKYKILQEYEQNTQTAIDERDILQPFDLDIPICKLSLHATNDSLQGTWKKKEIIIFDKSSNLYDYQLMRSIRTEIIENMSTIEQTQQRATLQILLNWLNRQIQSHRLQKLTDLQLRNL